MSDIETTSQESPAPAIEPASAPEAVPVMQATPSNVETTPEEVWADNPSVSLEEAAENLVAFVRDGRRAGDRDVDSAVDAVEAAIAARS